MARFISTTQHTWTHGNVLRELFEIHGTKIDVAMCLVRLGQRGQEGGANLPHWPQPRVVVVELSTEHGVQGHLVK